LVLSLAAIVTALFDRFWPSEDTDFESLVGALSERATNGETISDKEIDLLMKQLHLKNYAKSALAGRAVLRQLLDREASRRQAANAPSIKNVSPPGPGSKTVTSVGGH